MLLEFELILSQNIAAMHAEVVTVEDLEKFRIRLLADLAKIMQKPEPVAPLLRSAQVRKLLNVSPGTLQKLRIKGILPYTKLDGSFRYRLADVERALEGLSQ
jgi:hypothetical protein